MTTPGTPTPRQRAIAAGWTRHETTGTFAESRWSSPLVGDEPAGSVVVNSEGRRDRCWSTGGLAWFVADGSDSLWCANEGAALNRALALAGVP